MLTADERAAIRARAEAQYDPPAWADILALDAELTAVMAERDEANRAEALAMKERAQFARERDEGRAALRVAAETAAAWEMQAIEEQGRLREENARLRKAFCQDHQPPWTYEQNGELIDITGMQCPCCGQIAENKRYEQMREENARLRAACVQVAGDWHQLGVVSDASARKCSAALTSPTGEES